MIEELVDRIWAREAFHSDFRALVLRSLRLTVPGAALTWSDRRNVGTADRSREDDSPVQLDDAALRRLLQSATHFAASGRTEVREAAYRIAISAWAILHDSAEYNALRDVVHLVLGRLGNYPAVRHLYRGIPEAESQGSLPLTAWLPLRSHEEANIVQVAEGAELTLTDFQRDLWGRLEQRRSAAVNAPTSAGKSYALEHFLASAVGGGARRWAAYVVPTRALITQVSVDLLDTARSVPGGRMSVATIPIPPADLGLASGIYVLTQERLQVLLEADPSLRFDLAVIDEAQTLSEPARGVILQTVVEEIIRRSPNIQLLFAAPLVRDTEVFGRVFGVDVESMPRPERPVSQNLVFLDTDPLLRSRVNVTALTENVRQSLGDFDVGAELFDESQTLATLSFVLGAGEKNLVYAGSKSRCEDIAGRIRELVDSGITSRAEILPGLEGPLTRAAAPVSDDVSVAREDFAAFVRQHVHSEYSLADVVRSGVAFHYGNMPAIVRRTVEELFASGQLSHLVCTSTLLHGVNLPAKNLFLLDPTKGRDDQTREDIPISSLDFWNLAGRAGRLGKEFEGNVFLIDYARWQSQPVTEERERPIVPSLTQTLTARRIEFLEFARNRGHGSGSDPASENALVKLVNAERSGRLQETLRRSAVLTDEATTEIAETVSEVAASINVPPEITEKNITVSVFRQQEMLDYFAGRIASMGPRRVIPIHPARPWSEVHPSLIATFRRIHRYFEHRESRDESHKFFAPLALRWMRGDPLPLLIEDAIVYRRRKAPTARTATIIRNTLDNIENDLRFRYVKFTSCYQDLLAEALRRTGHEEFVASIPSLSLYLELGASSRTMISLVGLGLSRTTAALVAGRANNLNMERQDTRRWLASQPWSRIDLSPICVREIERILQTVGE